MRDFLPGASQAQEDWSLVQTIALTAAAALAFAIVTTIASNLARQRLIRKASRCIDTVQRALPKLEHAADLYIADNSPEPPAAPLPRSRKRK